MSDEHGKLITLSKGLGGTHGNYECGNATLSGYGELEDYTDRLAEGAWIVDLSPLFDDPRFASKSWRAPLPDPALEGDAIRRCPEPGPFLRAGVGGGFATAIAAHDAHRGTGAGPLDSVSPAAWAGYWIEAGARVGRFTGGAIEWAPVQTTRETVREEGAEVEGTDQLELSG